jgi:hypothetical protein
MRRFPASIILSASVALLCPPALAEQNDDRANTEVVKIPLDQIWAYNMPGTRDIRELEPHQLPDKLERDPPEEQREMKDQSLWVPLAMSLCADSSSHWPRKGEIARPGFVVAGTGREALSAAYDVLVKGAQPSESFPSGTPITLVFFSYQCGSYIQLEALERRAKSIDLQYRLIRPVNKIVTAHLALIPVGELLPGNYEVNTLQLPTGHQRLDLTYSPVDRNDQLAPKEEEFGRRFVSNPFKFAVRMNN